MIRSLFVTVAIVGAAAPILAAAQEVRTERVSYAGLDIHSAVGAATLQRRVKGALQRVCDPHTSDMLVATRVQRRCIAEAKPGVDAQLAAIGLYQPGSVSVLIAAR